MKTNLLRIGLRLSLVVIALLCGVYLAWGAGKYESDAQDIY